MGRFKNVMKSVVPHSIHPHERAGAEGGGSSSTTNDVLPKLLSQLKSKPGKSLPSPALGQVGLTAFIKSTWNFIMS